MADDLGSLVSEIMGETRRSMSVEITNLVLDSIAHYETERFWFNETRDTTFSLSTSQQIYTSADHSMIPRFMEVDRFEVTISANDKRGLDKKSYQWIQDYNDTNASSQPVAYAYWGQSFHVNIPDGGYAVRVSGIVQLPTLSATADSNAWTQRGNGKELIKQRAKSLLYSEYLRDDANAARAAVRERDAYDVLKKRTSRMQGTGEITPWL